MSLLGAFYRCRLENMRRQIFPVLSALYRAAIYGLPCAAASAAWAQHTRLLAPVPGHRAAIWLVLDVAVLLSAGVPPLSFPPAAEGVGVPLTRAPRKPGLQGRSGYLDSRPAAARPGTGRVRLEPGDAGDQHGAEQHDILVDCQVVGPKAHLPMVAPGVELEEGAEVGVGSAIGIGARLGARARVGPVCGIDTGTRIAAKARVGSFLLCRPAIGGTGGPAHRIRLGATGDRVSDWAMCG